MSDVEARLESMGIALGKPPSAAGNYLPYRISGNLMILSGMLPFSGGELTHKGKVGREQSEEEGYKAARNCVLTALPIIKDALGSLDRISKVLLVNGFVNGIEGFSSSPAIINGASDFLVELLGEAGKHARTAVSVSGLPLDATVELQITLEFD